MGLPPAYLSEYSLTVSMDAATGSTFEISIRPPPISALVDSMGLDIPFTTRTPCILTVGPPALSLVTESCSECVRHPGTVDVRLNTYTLDTAINGVQALFQYDPAVLQLSSVTPGDGEGSPWDVASVIAVQDNAGSVVTALVLNGGSSAVDATVATLHFSTVSTAATSVSFRPDSPPFFTKLTRAADNVTIFPGKIDDGGIIVGTRSKGDVNGDGLRNGDDIQPYLDALFNPGGVPGDQACAADQDGDGFVTADLDTPLLVDCLLNEVCTCP